MGGDPEGKAISRIICDGQKPEKRVRAENLLNVAPNSTVVDGMVIPCLLRRLLAELDCAHCHEAKPHVEPEESGGQNAEKSTERLPEKEGEHVVEILVPVQGFLHRRKHGPADQLRANERVEDELEEELVVPEANAIINPGTVVVHLQNTRAAHSAMVATIRLILVAPLAMSALAGSLCLEHPCRRIRILPLLLPVIDPLFRIRDLARVGTDAPDIAYDKQRRDNKESYEVRCALCNLVLVSQILRLMQLQKRDAMPEDVD